MSKAHKLLAKLKRLKMFDFPLFVVAFVLLAIIRLGLWLLPFRLLFNLLMQVRNPFSISANAQTTDSNVRPNLFHSPGIFLPVRSRSQGVRNIIWSINKASQYMPGGVKCLARAMATQVLMNWYCHRSELHIGVNKVPGGDFQAHAWVEYQGHVIIGDLKDLPKFKQLLTYQGRKA